MSILAIALWAQAATSSNGGPWSNRYTQWAQKPAETEERLGPGPHVLVISDGKGMTRIDYRTGALCLKARNEVRRQMQPDKSNPDPVISASPVRAFCVPR